MTCVHFLALAIAIQNERCPVARVAMLNALPDEAYCPVLSWLDADARRAITTLNRPNHHAERERARSLLAYIEATTEA